MRFAADRNAVPLIAVKIITEIINTITAAQLKSALPIFFKFTFFVIKFFLPDKWMYDDINKINYRYIYLWHRLHNA